MKSYVNDFASNYYILLRMKRNCYWILDSIVYDCWVETNRLTPRFHFCLPAKNDFLKSRKNPKDSMFWSKESQQFYIQFLFLSLRALSFFRFWSSFLPTLLFLVVVLFPLPFFMVTWTAGNLLTLTRFSLPKMRFLLWRNHPSRRNHCPEQKIYVCIFFFFPLEH